MAGDESCQREEYGSREEQGEYGNLGLERSRRVDSVYSGEQSCGFLRENLADTHRQSPNQDALAQTLTSTTYAALLPVIWSLLVQAPPSDKAPSIGKAFFEHIARLSSSSNIKSTGDALIVSLISIHEQRHPRLPFYVPLDSPLRPLIQQWVDSVPKVLWEIGVKDDVATRRLLGFLLEIGGKGREAFKSPHSLLARTVSAGIRR